jgi:hypothetical protein
MLTDAFCEFCILPPVKRRKLDAAALERAAARAAAQVVFLTELEKEEHAILAGEHPLLTATRQAIASEKARRLRNMKQSLEWKEREFARVRDASAERIWKEWAVSATSWSSVICDSRC